MVFHASNSFLYRSQRTHRVFWSVISSTATVQSPFQSSPTLAKLFSSWRSFLVAISWFLVPSTPMRRLNSSYVPSRKPPSKNRWFLSVKQVVLSFSISVYVLFFFNSVNAMTRTATRDYQRFVGTRLLLKNDKTTIKNCHLKTYICFWRFRCLHLSGNG